MKRLKILLALLLIPAVMLAPAWLNDKPVQVGAQTPPGTLRLIEDYGAACDNSADDTDEINEWIADMASTGKPGHIGTGVCKATQRVLFPMDGGGNGKTYVITCEGAYKSRIDVTGAPNNQGPQIHFYTATNGPTSHYPSITNCGFTGDTPNTLAAIGLDNLSDNVGNANFTNVYFGNANSGNSVVATTLQINYMFDSRFDNVVVVGKVGYGNALELRKSHFNTFTGGSYSNAGRGIRIPSIVDPGSYGNLFLGPDFENINLAIVSEEASAGANTFINPFFDIWRPDLNQPGTYAVYSSAASSKKLIIEHPYLTAHSPQTLVDPAHNNNVQVQAP